MAGLTRREILGVTFTFPQFGLEGEEPTKTPNPQFPGLFIPSKFDAETGWPTPRKAVIYTEGMWIFQGIGGQLLDKWFLLYKLDGELLLEFEVEGARYLIKNGARVGLDVETPTVRLQGQLINFWEQL